MNNVKAIQKLSETELKLGIKESSKSWHSMYSGSAYIFIGGLDYGLTEGDVLSIFSQYGEIVNINLVRDRKTGKSKGFCFLAYEDQRSTVLAVDNFNGIKVCGRTIRVDHVAEYRRPKDEHGNEIIEKGCAPKTPTPSPTPSPSPSDSPVLKRKKKLKKKKHKKLSVSESDEHNQKYKESRSSHIEATTSKEKVKRQQRSRSLSEPREAIRKRSGSRLESRGQQPSRSQRGQYRAGFSSGERWRSRSRSKERQKPRSEDKHRREMYRAQSSSTERRDKKRRSRSRSTDRKRQKSYKSPSEKRRHFRSRS